MEAELASFLKGVADQRMEDGRQAVVRKGYLPERRVQTGIGDVEVRVPKVRDRSGTGARFHSALLPPYLRRARSVEELIPWLYLKGVSTGDYQEALAALLGDGARRNLQSKMQRPLGGRARVTCSRLKLAARVKYSGASRTAGRPGAHCCTHRRPTNRHSAGR